MAQHLLIGHFCLCVEPEMTAFQSVGRSDIRLGEPLPYSVYDKSGILLLRAGFKINLERHLEVLLEKGLYCRPEEAAVATARPPGPSRNARIGNSSVATTEARNTFEALDTAKLHLQRLFEHIRLRHNHEEFPSRVESIALTVQETCTHDADAALANLHLDYDNSYAVVHHMQAALLCELIGKTLGVKEEVRLTLIKAALTHDLGLIDIQDTLDRQTEPLSAAQKERINSHPLDSVRQLQELGVTEAVWLDAVRHHHERLDGSGYPDQITADAISIPTRILAIADIYSAMVRDRPYRKAMVSKEAMRNLLIEQGSKTDKRLIQMMIKEIGVFPPGAIVKLVNGEIGVVKLRQENSAFPIVYSFLRQGMPMLSPLRRETIKAEFNVDGIVPFSNYRGCISLIRNLWLDSNQRKAP
jgi:HD-GYP domain-containing protein (c-di-GMP phosphodiesterase class II)